MSPPYRVREKAKSCGAANIAERNARGSSMARSRSEGCGPRTFKTFLDCTHVHALVFSVNINPRWYGPMKPCVSPSYCDCPHTALSYIVATSLFLYSRT